MRTDQYQKVESLDAILSKTPNNIVLGLDVFLYNKSNTYILLAGKGTIITERIKSILESNIHTGSLYYKEGKKSD